MSYSHKTKHAFTPSLEFWRSLENFLESFPYKQENTGYLTGNEFINYYERKYDERFDVDYNDTDIYGKHLTRKYIWSTSQRFYLDEMDSTKRISISPEKIQKNYNSTGRLIKFLSNSISNSDTVYKFQHFFECTYYYLNEINKLNPDLQVIKSAGLDDKNHALFPTRWERFKNRNGGLMQASDFSNRFNEICRVHHVPFAMLVFNNSCYVIHTTDIFVEKIIQDLPLFLTDPNLKGANSFFINAYTLRDEGNHKECLAKIREGLEAVRDYIYTRHNLTKSISVHKDLEELFNTHSAVVFDFTKIPEDDSIKLNKIIEYLRDSLLLTVKMGNFGHHTLTRPHLLEESSSIFTLGLVSSILPYIIYLLK